jgi:multidrug resistance efflux pump
VDDQAHKIEDLQAEVASLQRELQRKNEQLNQQQEQIATYEAQNQALFQVNSSDADSPYPIGQTHRQPEVDSVRTLSRFFVRRNPLLESWSATAHFLKWQRRRSLFDSSWGSGLPLYTYSYKRCFLGQT